MIGLVPFLHEREHDVLGGIERGVSGAVLALAERGAVERALDDEVLAVEERAEDAIGVDGEVAVDERGVVHRVHALVVPLIGGDILRESEDVSKAHGRSAGDGVSERARGQGRH